jgi:putative phosphoribosyl transferase
MRFEDRVQAGRLLAERLEHLRPERPVVLGLTRGGVPVAFEVARSLGAELDALVVRKLGAPGAPEYAIGAIAEGGAVHVNPEAVRDVGIGDEEVAALAERESAEVARRVRAYRGGRPPVDLAGRTVVVIDDGVATGETARAACRAARGRGAARVVLAAPVLAAASGPSLRDEFDEVVAVEAPQDFFAVSQWYERFGQVSDDDVVRYLRRAREERPDEAGELWNGEWMEEGTERASPGSREETLSIPLGGPPPGPGSLLADLSLPSPAIGLVLFAHGSGSGRRSPRNRAVARALQRAGLATLLLDLLGRVLAAARWAAALPGARGLRLGYFGASTGAAAALAAAAEEPALVGAIVSRGGRPDLVAPSVLQRVRAPVLLVVGSRDETVLRLNRAVLPHLAFGEIAVVPGATHLFEERGALAAVARLAAAWFRRHLAEPAAARPPPAA